MLVLFINYNQNLIIKSKLTYNWHLIKLNTLEVENMKFFIKITHCPVSTYIKG